MSRVRFVLVLSLVALMLAGAFSIVSAADPVTVTLDAQNDSGESGTATLTDLGNGKVRVEVSVTGAPAGVPQPLHIHQGTCANLNPKPEFPLTSAVDGKSVTEIDANFADLQNGDYAINGHKSAAEASVYVFCGNIPAMAAATTLPATGANMATNILVTAMLGLLALVMGLFMVRSAKQVR